MRFDKKIDTAAALRELIRRAGYRSLKAFALACGLRGQSSVQRYVSSDHFGNRPLPARFLDQAAVALAGRGTPPIKRIEIMSLGDIDIDAIIAAESEAVAPKNAAPKASLTEDGPAFRSEKSETEQAENISNDFLSGARLALEALNIDPFGARGQLIIAKLILARQGIKTAEIERLAEYDQRNKNH